MEQAIISSEKSTGQSISAMLNSFNILVHEVYRKFDQKLHKNLNKTRTSRVGAVSKAQKAQNIILDETWSFWKVFSCKKSRTVPKNVKEGTLFDFQTCILLQNNKILKGGPLGTLEKFRKSRTVPKKSKGWTL